MGFDLMLRSFLLGAALLALTACGKQAAESPEPDASGGPQIATSLEDYALPVDRSSQITTIDAATGDAGGMPKDGGPVITEPKPEPRESVDAPEVLAPPVPPTNPAPVLILPPPPAPVAAGY